MKASNLITAAAALTASTVSALPTTMKTSTITSAISAHPQPTSFPGPFFPGPVITEEGDGKQDVANEPFEFAHKSVKKFVEWCLTHPNLPGCEELVRELKKEREKPFNESMATLQKKPLIVPLPFTKMKDLLAFCAHHQDDERCAELLERWKEADEIIEKKVKRGTATVDPNLELNTEDIRDKVKEACSLDFDKKPSWCSEFLKTNNLDPNEYDVTAKEQTSRGVIMEVKHAAVTHRKGLLWDKGIVEYALWDQCRQMPDDKMCKQYNESKSGVFLIKFYGVEGHPKGVQVMLTMEKGKDPQMRFIDY